MQSHKIISAINNDLEYQVSQIGKILFKKL